jgi:hypothetical protein
MMKHQTLVNHLNISKDFDSQFVKIYFCHAAWWVGYTRSQFQGNLLGYENGYCHICYARFIVWARKFLSASFDWIVRNNYPVEK